MNLVIDIGNRAAKYYVFDAENLVSHTTEAGHAMQQLPQAPTGSFDAAIVCSVVNLTDEAEAALMALRCPLTRFTTDTKLPIANAYHTPRSLGTDRLAAAMGAWAQQPDSPLLIIDVGSCITFDLVTPDEGFAGGNIAPGIYAQIKALAEYFPRLPLVKAEGELPEMGFDTETAIRAGVIKGIAREAEGYITHLKAKHSNLKTYITGGDAHLIAKEMTEECVEAPFLVARGLNHILRHSNTQN